MARRLLFVQYAGDYREAFNRLAAGGQENYYAQKASIDTVANLKQFKLGQPIDEVATLCCLTTTRYDQLLDNGVRAIGAGFDHTIDDAELLRLIAAFNPTHLVLRTPIAEVLRWAIRQQVRTLVTLADSFNGKGLRSRIYYIRLARLLNHRGIDWVGNHGITAALSLKEIGVDSNKIIPWDFPHRVSPDAFQPKSVPAQKTSWNAIFVGAVIQDKGIGDLLQAIAMLKAKGFPIALKVVGKGDIERYGQQAKDLKIETCVEFLGPLPNPDIIPQMRAADVVIVPSRHAYPEGFPLTIYEALCSRSPLVISNHPMFCDKLTNGVNALIFPAGKPKALAACIEQLCSSPALYQSLSLASEEAWQSLQLPTEWGKLISRWLSDSAEDGRWLFKHRLASGRYLSKQVQKNRSPIAAAEKP